jgi:hypothetical protein
MASPWFRLRAWVALVAFFAVFGSGLATFGHAGLGDDEACGDVSLTNGHTSVAFGLPRAPAPLKHCPFCHWQRSVSGVSVASAAPSSVQLEPSDLLTPATTPAVRSAAREQATTRGPPSLSI